MFLLRRSKCFLLRQIKFISLYLYDAETSLYLYDVEYRPKGQKWTNMPLWRRDELKEMTTFGQKFWWVSACFNKTNWNDAEVSLFKWRLSARIVTNFGDELTNRNSLTIFWRLSAGAPLVLVSRLVSRSSLGSSRLGLVSPREGRSDVIAIKRNKMVMQRSRRNSKFARSSLTLSQISWQKLQCDELILTTRKGNWKRAYSFSSLSSRLSARLVSSLLSYISAISARARVSRLK